MKKLLVLIAMAVSGIGSAQDYFTFYIPTYTSHFVSYEHEPYHNGFLGSQGGQGGVIASYNREDGRGYRSFSLGVLQNSYGDLIGTVTTGKHYGDRFKVGYEYGITYGYGQSYNRNRKKVLDAGAEVRINPVYDYTMKTNLAPVITGVISYRVTDRIGVKALVNPLFINLGINIKL